MLNVATVDEIPVFFCKVLVDKSAFQTLVAVVVAGVKVVAFHGWAVNLHNCLEAKTFQKIKVFGSRIAASEQTRHHKAKVDGRSRRDWGNI